LCIKNQTPKTRTKKDLGNYLKEFVNFFFGVEIERRVKNSKK